MAKLYLKRTLAGFAAADEAAVELMRKFKVGGVYRADVVKPRSYQHHKLAMALMSLTYENLPDEYVHRWKSFNEFRYGVAVDAGHCIEIVSPNGELFKQARSISYDELDEVEFGEVMPRLMTVCAHLLHDMDLNELEAEVSRYADEHYGVAA